MSTLIAADFSGYTVDAAPPVTLGPELWDGTYDNRYIDHVNTSFINSAATRTTKLIAVTPGEIYCFSGGNRTRLMWEDANGTYTYASDEGNTGDARYAIAPASAVGVYYYYTNENDTNASVKLVTGGFAPAWVISDVNYRIRQLATEKVLRAEMTGTTNARRFLVFADQVELQNGSVRAKLSTSALIQTTASTIHMGVAARCRLAAGNEYGYIACLRRSTTESQFQIAKYVNGTFTILNTTNFAFLANTDYWIELDCSFSAIRAKAWADGDAKPVDWMISVTDTSHSVGQAGVFTLYSADSSHYYEVKEFEWEEGIDWGESLRVTQQYIEAAVVSENRNARVTQQYIEAAVVSENRNARVTQQYIEAAAIVVIPSSVTTQPAMDISGDSATLNADITLGDESTVDAHFQYRIVDSPTWTETTPETLTTDGSISVILSGLIVSVNYEFRAVVTWQGEYLYGDTLTFISGENSISMYIGSSFITGIYIGNTPVIGMYLGDIYLGGSSI